MEETVHLLVARKQTNTHTNKKTIRGEGCDHIICLKNTTFSDPRTSYFASAPSGSTCFLFHLLLVVTKLVIKTECTAFEEYPTLSLWVNELVQCHLLNQPPFGFPTPLPVLVFSLLDNGSAMTTVFTGVAL